MPPDLSEPIYSLRWAGPNSYTLRIGGETVVVRLEQIQLFLTYDAALREGKLENPVPMGYEAFARHFNVDDNSQHGVIQFVVLTNHGRDCTRSPLAPTLRDILGARDAEARMKEEREKGKGSWLSEVHTEIMDDMLWEQADRTRREKKACSRAIQERKEKRNVKGASLEERLQPGPRRRDYRANPYRRDQRTPHADRARPPIPTCAAISVVDGTPSLPVSPHTRADDNRSVDEVYPYLPVSPNVHVDDQIAVDTVDLGDFHLDEDIPVRPDDNLTDLSADVSAAADSMMATILGDDPSGSTGI